MVAGVELVSACRLRSGYVTALEDNLRRRGPGLPRVTHYSFNHVTVGRPQTKTPRTARESPARAPRKDDPVVEAFSALRSGDSARIRLALQQAATEPALVGAVIPLLGRSDLLDEVGAALRAHGARVAGQLADALLASDTPDVVRRRLPLVLASCVSKQACEGLVEGLRDHSLTVRRRCCRAC